MNDPVDNRPDPDRLLHRVQEEEARSGRGKLKLFFGASPGVGKTYAMLEAARARRREGWDVAIGVVETHGRAETEALLEGLDILPRRVIDHRGVQLSEFDVDAAIARRPRLLLVDELAHSNAPGLRHAKRWQDVDEILSSGIDVYTTLNVQHWESLNDVVARITGVTVRETVPDTFLQRADDLELIDIPTPELLKRLHDGKIYRGEIAGRAGENFFKLDNLTALRELALRHAAERVDAQRASALEPFSWTGNERLLVGVAGSPVSDRVVRGAARLAARLRAPWTVVTVETPRTILTSGNRFRAQATLRLAEQLGARTLTVMGEDVAGELIAAARKQRATRLVLGKPTRSPWAERLFGSVVGDVARRCGDIDLHIISGLAGAPRETPSEGPRHPSLLSGAPVVAAATVACLFLSKGMHETNLAMIYLLGVVFTAQRYGPRASVSATVLSVLAFDYFFVPPRFTFAVSDVEYLVTFGVLLGVGLLVGALASQRRAQVGYLKQREDRLQTLYTLSRSLSETPHPARMLELSAAQLETFFHRPVLLLTPRAGAGLSVSAGDPDAFGWNDNEQAVARWVFDRGERAGAGSETLSGAKGLYLPLKALRGTVGVLGIRPAKAGDFKDDDTWHLLETIAGEIGAALESTRLSEEAGRTERMLETQALERHAEAKSVRWGDFLTESRVQLLPPGWPRDQILRRLISALDVPSPEHTFRAVMDRIKSGPTTLEGSVVLFHVRVDGLTSIQSALGFSPQCPGSIHVLFVSPKENPRLHLQFLAAVARFFQIPERATTLLSFTSAREALEFIRRGDVPSPPDAPLP